MNAEQIRQTLDEIKSGQVDWRTAMAQLREARDTLAAQAKETSELAIAVQREMQQVQQFNDQYQQRRQALVAAKEG